MKKIMLAAVFFVLGAVILCGCSEQGVNNTAFPEPDDGQFWFDAVVKEIHGNTLLVECENCPDGALAAGSLVTFAPSRAADPESHTAFSAGQRIRVVYDGMIMETYPAQLGNVYGVYTLDDAVNCD